MTTIMPSLNIEDANVHEFDVLNDFECRNCGKTPDEVEDESYCRGS